jgi:archaellum component FlaC
MNEKVNSMTKTQAEMILEKIKKQDEKIKELIGVVNEVASDLHAVTSELVVSLRESNSFSDLKKDKRFNLAYQQTHVDGYRFGNSLKRLMKE